MTPHQRLILDAPEVNILLAELNDPAMSPSSDVSSGVSTAISRSLNREKANTRIERGWKGREGKNTGKNKGMRCKNIKIKIFSL